MMPLTPREDEEETGVRTRAQHAAEALARTNQATPTDETVPTGHGHLATPTGQASPTMRAMSFDFSRIMQMLESMHEGQVRIQEEQTRMREDQARKQDEQALKLDEQARKQDEILSAVGMVSDTVVQIRKDVDSVQERVTELETDVDHVKTNLTGLQKKVLRLETVGVTSSGAGTCSATHGPRVKVPPYDGTTSWAAYRQQFQTVAAANGWSDEQSLTALTVALRGSALSVLEALPTSGSKFKDLMEALESRYGERHLEHVFRAQLRDRVQRPSEGLQQWALEIEKLVRKAYPSADTKMIDSNMLQAFVDGIRDLETRAAVRLRHHASLKEALAHALEVEAVRQDVRQVQKVREVSEVVNEIKLPTKRTPGPMCYKCGERGHLQLTCPKRNSIRQLEERMEELAKKQETWLSSAKNQGNE